MNIKEAEIATIDTAIADKTDIYSVTTADVADRFKELVALLGAILVNPDLTYNIGLIVYTASPFAIYGCKVDGATGDISNQTNWLKIAGAGLPYLVADTEVEISVITGASNSDYYIPYPIILSAKAGVLFDLRITGVATTNYGQVGYGITIDTSGSIEGSSVLIKTDMNGVGMSTLVVDETNYERLEAGATYLFTKTTDLQDDNGYILTKVSGGSIKIQGDGGSFTASIGKYIVVAGGGLKLPLAEELGGKSVELFLASAGTFGVTLTGSDSIVNIASLTYDRPLMKFTSDGVDKWYYS